MAFPVTTIPPSSGGGGGSSDFGDITGWPGASTDFVRGDGSDAPLSAADIRATVTGTAGEGKVVADDGASGLEWISPGGGATDLDGLSDVVITTPASGHGLFHNGTNFVNRALVPGDMPVGSVSYVKNTSDQTVTGAADNVLTLDSAILDPSSMLGSNKITVPVAGKYLVTTTLSFNSNSTHYTCSLCHRKNGSTKSPAHKVYAGNGGEYTLSVISLWDLAASDYLESIWRPGNLINYPLGGLCTMSVERVGS